MTIFFVIAGFFALFGGLATSQAKNATAGIEALLLFVMATLSFGFAAVIRAIYATKAGKVPADAARHSSPRQIPDRHRTETPDEYAARLARLGLRHPD